MTRFRWRQNEWSLSDSWAVSNLYIGQQCPELCNGHGRCVQGQCVCVKTKTIFVIYFQTFRLILISFIFTSRKRSLGQGSVFTQVCHSCHRWKWGWLPSIHYRSYDQRGPLPKKGGGSLHPGGSASGRGGRGLHQGCVCIQQGVGQGLPTGAGGGADLHRDTWDTTG